MREELLRVVTCRDYPLGSVQKHISGYVDPNKGWDMARVNSWFNERGYEFVGLLDLFSGSEPGGICVSVDGYVWRCRTNAHDNSLYWYWESDNKGDALGELRFLHGCAYQFVWGNGTRTYNTVNMAE